MMPSSVVVQNCSISNDVGSMRGVVETSSFPSLGGSVSVSIVGCSFDSSRILGKDGIGLSLTRPPRRNEEEVARLSSSLIGCSLVNMSSIGSSREPCLRHLDQKMLGCVVSLTSSHLSGSTIRDVNTVGCVLCSNSSFSSLLSSPNTDPDSNEEPSITLPDGSAGVFEEGGVCKFEAANGTAATSVTFSHCPFNGGGIPTTTRPLAFDEYPGSITLLSCSFIDVNYTGRYEQGGTVSIDASSAPATSKLRIELCNFTGCSVQYTGGGLFVSSTAVVTVTGCRCVGCSLGESTGRFGGGMDIRLTPTPGSTVSDMYFEQCTSPDIAGGLNLGKVEKTHVVTSLSFKGCSAHSPYDRGIGGGMNISTVYALTDPITASFLKFEDCSTDQKGGGLVAQSDFGTITLSDCEFVRCTLTNTKAKYVYGAGLYGYLRSSALTVKDCQFIDCSSTLLGGAVCQEGGGFVMSECLVKNCHSVSTGAVCFIPRTNSPISLKNVLFVGNTVSDTPTYFDQHASMKGSVQFADFLIENEGNLNPSDISITDCWTTTTPNSVGMYTSGTNSKNQKTYTRVFKDAFLEIGPYMTHNVEATRDEDSWRLDLSVKGKIPLESQVYEVTLNETVGGTEAKGQLKFVNGVGSLLPSSTSILKYSTAYTITSIVGVVPSSSESNAITITAEAWAFNLNKTPTFLSFTTPTGPTLTNIKADLNPSNLNEAEVSVKVSPCAAGDFTLLIFDDSDEVKPEISIGPFSFDVSSPGATSSRTVLIHGSEKLSYGKTYTVKMLSSSTVIVSHSGETVKMPDAPARISFANPTLSGVNKTFVTLSLTGEALPCDSDFTIVVKEMEGDVIKEGASGISLTGKIGGTSGSMATTCSVSEEIYNKSATLEYSVRYKIVSLSVEGKGGVADPTAKFKVPDSPGRVEQMIPSKLNGEETEVSVVVTGVGLTASISTIVVKRGGKKFSSTSIEFISATELRANFSTRKEESETELGFEKNYEIESVSGQSGMFLNSGVGFTVPLPGIVRSTSTLPNPDTNEHFKVIVNGENFVSGSEWTLKLKDRSEEISVTMKSETMGESSWVKGGGLTEIEFDKTYALLTMTETLNSSEHIVCAGVSLTTPTGPTLTNIKADLNPLNLNEGEVSVTVSPCAAGDFTLLILDDSDEVKPEISIGPFSFDVSSPGATSSRTVLIHGSEKLSYGKTYTVKMLSSSTVIVSHSGETVKMPDAPARISFAEATLSGLNKTFVTLSLSGESLPGGKDLTIVVKEMEGDVIKEGASGISLTGKIEGTSGSTSTTCSVSEEIYNKTGTLEYSLKYKIVSLSIVGLKCIVDPTATFEVLDSPGRVESINAPLLSDLKTAVSVVVKGVNFPSSITSVSVKHAVSLISSTSVVWNSESQLTASFGAGQIQSTSTLAFGEQYEISSVSAGSIVYVNPSLVFSIASLLKTASSDLHAEDYDDVVVSLAGNGFPQSAQISLTLVEVDGDDTQTGESFVMMEDSSLSQETLSHSLSSPTSTQLQHGRRYEITKCDVIGQETVLDGRVFFDVPARTTLTGVDFSFATTSNTTFHLILKGKDLPVGETFLVSLDGFDEEVEVTFTNTSEGSSAELALGWSDTLQFDTANPLRSVIHKDTPTLSLPSTHLTLQTQPCPNPLILYATDLANSDPKFCGAVDRPCSSVDVAWVIVEAYSAQTVSLVLMKKALLASQMVIESTQDVIVEKHVLPPTLVIPSTASLADSAGLVSVMGTLVLKEVNIDIQIAALSFVLFDVKGGELTMNSVQISSVSSSSAVIDGIEGLCSWETGLIKLHDAEMETHSCEFSSIGMGEIWMESSTLSLISTRILSNGARFSAFPSAQQDVMCKSGNISILPYSLEILEDHWISSTSDCSVVLNESELKSPHFVPSLDVKNCRSTLSKKKDSFSVSIVGLKLIPCDLKLEVFESYSQSSKMNTDPVVIDLSFSSVESWNESDITLSVPSSDLSSLSSNEEWKARIVFGKDQHTASFTFLESLKNRKAEALQQSLPWLIPIIVCLSLLLLVIIIVVVIVIYRRRKASKSDSEALLSKQELNEVDEIKMEVEMQPYHTTNGVIAHKLDDPQTAMSSDEMEVTQAEFRPEKSRPLDDPVEALQCEGQFAVVTVDGQHTLYNRIHKGDGVGEGKRREIERKIVRGMLKMVEKHNLESGTRISPHWILLNRSDSVFIREESELEKQDHVKPSLPSNTHPSLSRLGVKDGIEEIRWRAPEQGEKEGEMKEGVEASKVMVFRLGLIIWEIETGLVPFGELDAVNAHRNLAAGIGLPLQKVSDGSMRELIEGCLQIDADLRLTLQQTLSKLDGMPEGSGKEELKDHFVKF